MTATVVITALLTVLFGDRHKRPRDRGLMSHVVNGRQHTPGCPYGAFLRPTDRETNGSGCSDRCVAAWTAFALAVAYLDAHAEPEPLPLLAAEGVTG